MNSLLSSSHVMDYISAHILFDLERCSLNIHLLLYFEGICEF